MALSCHTGTTSGPLVSPAAIIKICLSISGLGMRFEWCRKSFPKPLFAKEMHCGKFIAPILVG